MSTESTPPRGQDPGVGDGDAGALAGSFERFERAADRERLAIAGCLADLLEETRDALRSLVGHH